MSAAFSQHVKKPAGRRTAAIAGACLLAAAGAGAFASWREIRAQYLLATRFDRLGTNAQGYRHIETGIVFVRLPGGTFWMGSTEEEARAVPANLGLDKTSDEMPRHAVTLSPFVIAKFEASQSEWARVMARNPSHSPGEARPVERITWDDAKEFCRRGGLALPTEAQSEYACRAGTDGRFSGTGRIHEMGWTAENARPNGFGIHDMHGNVAEWCEDVHDPGFYSRPEATARDPVARVARVARGGDTHNPLFCRSATRVYYDTLTAGADIGFRPVFNLR